MNKLYLNTKDDLVASLGCDEVVSFEKLFMASDAKDIADLGSLANFVYEHNQKTSNIAFFSLLILDSGLYVGGEWYAKKLQKAFGGELEPTGLGHTAEFKWVCPTGALDKYVVMESVFK